MPAVTPAAQPPALPVTFRPGRTRAILLSAGVLIFFLISGIGMALDLSPGERSSFVATGLLALAVLTLLSRPKVTAADAGVTVTNLTTVRRLDWAEILQVNLRPGDAWVHLDLADGTTLPAMGIQPGLAKAQAISDARALRALVEAHGTTASTS